MLISNTVSLRVSLTRVSLPLVHVRVYEMISPFCMASSGGLHVHIRLVISTVMEKFVGVPLGTVESFKIIFAQFWIFSYLLV